jgi:hypothetical protein
MAGKVNRYGRQIFLSREEIETLRALCNGELEGLSDQITEAQEALESDPDDVFWKQHLAAAQKVVKVIRKLVGDNTKGDNGKLWYYVQASELNG